MMLRNFRLVAAQSSPVSRLGQLDYREGWFAIIPKEGQPGETLCGIQVHLNDKSLAEFPNRDWPAIEHWAERGLLKPDVWKARRTNLSLIVKLEMPISGTSIQIQQQALQFDQVPDSWPCNLESGWAAHYGRLDMPFEALCQHLVQNQFTSDAFQGDSESHLFQWSTNIWETWPVIEGHNFKEDWDKEGHINHPKRSETALTTDDIHQLQQDTPAHNELRAPMNQFMERQFANQEPLRNNLLIPALEARINKAAKLRGDFAQMIHTISRNFTIRDIVSKSISGTSGAHPTAAQIAAWRAQIKLWSSSSFTVRATCMYIFRMKRLCTTIVWKVWVPLASLCLTQCCQQRTRRLRVSIRTHWVKAQLSSCR